MRKIFIFYSALFMIVAPTLSVAYTDCSGTEIKTAGHAYSYCSDVGTSNHCDNHYAVGTNEYGYGTYQCRWSGSWCMNDNKCHVNHCNDKPAPMVDWSGCDKSNQSFTNPDLTKANLLKTDFRYATLINANLLGANLTNADLTGADLTGADLTDAITTGTDFSGATWTDGTKCNPGSVGGCLYNNVLNIIPNTTSLTLSYGKSGNITYNVYNANTATVKDVSSVGITCKIDGRPCTVEDQYYAMLTVDTCRSTNLSHKMSESSSSGTPLCTLTWKVTNYFNVNGTTYTINPLIIGVVDDSNKSFSAIAYPDTLVQYIK